MEFFDNDADSSCDECIGPITSIVDVELTSKIEEEQLLGNWDLNDSIYEDDQIDDNQVNPRQSIFPKLCLSRDENRLWGSIKRPSQPLTDENQKKLKDDQVHINEIHNPFLDNPTPFNLVAMKDCVYIDADDSNLVFSCELPSSNNNTQKSLQKPEVKSSRPPQRVRTRVILNPPNHSKIAREFLLVTGGMTQEEMSRFHRPSFPRRGIELMCEYVRGGGETRREDHLVQSIRSMADLSSTSDHLIIIEYSEPQPPMFLNQGMAAYIVNWINPHPDETTWPQPVEGVNRILTEYELMPLMGSLSPGSSLLSLCSSLYNTPIFPHECPMTDYLLIVKMESPHELSLPTSSSYTAYIRRADNLFVAGKMEPIMRVYQPYDANFVNTAQTLEFYLLQLYFKKMNKLTYDQMCRIFPSIYNQAERDLFEEHHKNFFDVTNRVYRLKNSILPVSVPRHLTPESVCLLQACQVDYDRLLASGVTTINNFVLTQGTMYLRVRENLDCIQYYIDKRIQSASTQIQRESPEEITTEENCSLQLQLKSYLRMKKIIDRECKAANFFVERVYRTSWNLTDQYINSIIEKKGRLNMVHSSYFDTDITFAEAVGEPYLFLPSKTLRNRKNTTAPAAKRHRQIDPDSDTDSQEELSPEEENNQEEETPQRKVPDLRKLNKSELHKMAADLGLPSEQIKSMARWALVQFVSTNSLNDHQEYYRDKKHDQQFLNSKFQEQVNKLFEDQMLRLTNALPLSEQGITIPVINNIFADDTLPIHMLEPLKSPDQLGLFTGFDTQSGKEEVPGLEPEAVKPICITSESGMSVGGLQTAGQSADSTKKMGHTLQILSDRGKPLLVRHVRLSVQKDGEVKRSVSYSRSAKDVRSALENEKKFSPEVASLTQLLQQYNKFDASMPQNKRPAKPSFHHQYKQQPTKHITVSRKRKEKRMEGDDESIAERNPRQLTRLLQSALKVVTNMDALQNFKKLPFPGAPWAENYRSCIGTVIDLDTIDKNIDRFGYTHVDFLREINMLYENTAKFNGENHELTIMAKSFVVEAESYVQKNIDKFKKAEEQLLPQADIPIEPYDGL